MKKIRVLIADDSKTSTKLLASILNESDDIEVIAEAKDGLEAVKLTQLLKPDIITMDVMMPNLNGIEATKVIMQHCPTPIIIISSYLDNKEIDIGFDALQAGALSLIPKPSTIDEKQFNSVKKYIINSVKSLSEVRVVTRRLLSAEPVAISSLLKPKSLQVQVVAIGVSTGGPEALKTIFSALPATFPVPIVVVQHIAKGFLEGLTHWLKKYSVLPMEIAEHNKPLLPGHIYFAPDNVHLTINKSKTPVACLKDSPLIHHFRPSINPLFDSLAQAYPNQAVGGLLTGMGKDGVEGLLNMNKSGCVTFAQSERSCVVFGMPQAAIETKAANHIVDLLEIPEFLAKLICWEEQK